MKKVIVTGAGGFVGSAVCKELVRQGVEVFAVTNKVGKLPSDIRRKIHCVQCDLSDYEKLPDLIIDRDVDVFYHFAWSGTSGILRGDVNIQINNIRYSCEAIKAANCIGCKRFIFASSIMEYEISAIMDTEATPAINTLYSSAKLATNYMIRTLAGNLDIEYIRVVISNIYGPGEKNSRLINTSLRKMINGEHVAFSSGEQMYDFIYIDDAAKAFVKIGEFGITNRTYYLGSLEPKLLKDFLLEMRDCIDPSIKIGLGELSFGGVSLTYKEFDIENIKRDTGFEPQVSFEEGIKNTVKWLKEDNL